MSAETCSTTSGNWAASLQYGKSLTCTGDTAVNSANGDRAAAVFTENNKGTVTKNGNVSVKMSGDATYGLLAMTEGTINAEA